MADQERAARFRGLAAKLRLEIAETSDATIRETLAELARRYETLADWLLRRNDKSS